MSAHDWSQRLTTELPDLLEHLCRHPTSPRTPTWLSRDSRRRGSDRAGHSPAAGCRPRWPAIGSRRHRSHRGDDRRRPHRVRPGRFGDRRRWITAAATKPLRPRSGRSDRLVADGRIWLAGPDGSAARPISEGGTDLHPVFSPDGTKLAFVRLAARDSHPNWQEWGTVIVADAEGGHPAVIDADQEGISPFSWSADGRLLIYSKIIAGADQLVVAQADGSWAQRSRTRRRAAGVRSSHRMANGSLSFDRPRRASSCAPSTLTARTTTRSRTDPVPRFDLGAWSPNSSTIVFGAGEPAGLAADLWRLNTRTGEVTPFVTGAGNQMGPTWSPDGGHIRVKTVDQVVTEQRRRPSGGVGRGIAPRNQRAVVALDLSALVARRSARRRGDLAPGRVAAHS